MPVITNTEEQKRHSDVAVYGGLKFAGAALLSSAVLAGAFTRMRWKPFTNLTLPLKTFAIVAPTCSAFMVGADRAALNYEREQAAIRGQRGKELEKSVGLYQPDGPVQVPSHAGVMDHLRAFGSEHKWPLVGAGWASAMVGSFAYVHFTPLSTAQKLVQARMYAQFVTVGIVILSALLATTSREDKAEARENDMYKYKPNSPHALREKEQHAEAIANQETNGVSYK